VAPCHVGTDWHGPIAGRPGEYLIPSSIGTAGRAVGCVVVDTVTGSDSKASL
jgi:hypothetical protein